MISGLVRKTLRETWIQTLLFGASLLVIEALLTFIYPQLQEQLNHKYVLQYYLHFPLTW